MTQSTLARSWVTSANGHRDFPLQNLPLGVFSINGAAPRSGSNVLVDNSGPIRIEFATGVFGAHMRVQLINDGPVTFWLQTRRPAG